MTHRVTITGWNEGLRKISLSKLLRESAELSLSASKHTVDDILEGRTVVVEFPTRGAAERFAEQARKLNAVCIVED